MLADDGRVGVDVALRIEPISTTADTTADTAADTVAVTSANRATTADSKADWQFFCADPTYYWVTEFATPAAPLAVSGCASPVQSMAVAVATGPRAGSVEVGLRCVG